MMNKSFMRRAFLQVLALIGLLLLSGSLASADQVLSIPLNNAERLKIRGTAKDVIIANPAVADVTVLEPDQFIIIGKQAGRTTLLILDSQERVLLSSMVVVSDGSGGLVTVHAPRGDAIRQDDYACAQNCTLIEGSNATVNKEIGSSNKITAETSDAGMPPPPAPVTKVDSKIKLKVSPNGEITGTRTDVPTYQAAPQ